MRLALACLVLAVAFDAAAVPAQSAAQRVLELVNKARATPRHCGDKAFGAAAPVRWNATLAEVSRLHAEDMARHNYFSHSSRDGTNPGQRIERAGYRYRAIGENIAAGTRMQPEDAVAGWIRSPPHCANLMNPAYAEMGAAFAVKNRGAASAVNAASELNIYWAQAFGTQR